MARPSRYTPELAESVLQQLRAGRGLRAVCAGAGMPSARTVQAWVNGDVDGFAAACRAARDIGRPRGVPSFTPGIAAQILAGLRAGRLPIEICRDPGMPRYATLRDWIRHDRHGFAAPYRTALRAGGRRFARPVRHSTAIADRIFHELCEGRSLEAICAAPGMPTAAAVRRWVAADRNGFAGQYHIARRFGCDSLADEMIAIADDISGDLIPRIAGDGGIEWVPNRGAVRRAALRCEVRRKRLSRRLRDLDGAWR